MVLLKRSVAAVCIATAESFVSHDYTELCCVNRLCQTVCPCSGTEVHNVTYSISGTASGT